MPRDWKEHLMIETTCCSISVYVTLSLANQNKSTHIQLIPSVAVAISVTISVTICSLSQCLSVYISVSVSLWLALSDSLDFYVISVSLYLYVSFFSSTYQLLFAITPLQLDMPAIGIPGQREYNVSSINLESYELVKATSSKDGCWLFNFRMISMYADSTAWTALVSTEDPTAIIGVLAEHKSFVSIFDSCSTIP